MKSGLMLFIVMMLVPVVSSAAPVIEFIELKHDFGTVGQEEKAEHFFEFANRGDQELIIEKVSAS